MGPGFDSLFDIVQNDDDLSSPSTGDATSSAPPPEDDTMSSPPADSSSSSPPPASSPPPPDSSPPPPASSPPPEKSESPSKEDSPSAPPPKAESPPSPPPPKEESPPSPPSPDKSPSPEKSPATPPPATSVGTTPTIIVLQSPPSPVKQSGATAPPHHHAEKLTPPSGVDSRSSNVPPPASSSSSSVSAGVIAAVVVVGVGLLAAVIIFFVCAARRKKRKQYYMDAPGNEKGDYYGTSNWNNTPQNLRPPPGQMGSTPNGFSNWSGPHGPPGPYSGEFSSGFSGQHQMGMSPNMGLSNQSSFSYEELARATNGFAEENVIGQGGFGYVHKGVLPSGKEVAVKSLKSGSGQGDREFQAEVEIISRVHHRHLVSLVGYCVANGQRMLVYEFVPNKTMEFHLHGKGRPVMQWSTRMRIALGAAKGLAYLHEDCHPKIIHRDIKSANILLDFNFEAMVADFGLAKLTSDTNTHVSTRVMGTFGYMAPEYASSGKLTDKSDVFSFGVMLLELITGRKPIDLTNETMEDSLVDWARPLLGRALEEGNYGELVDPLLENNFDPHEMDRMIACAAASIRHSAKRRPKMAQIVRSLEGDQSSLDDTAIKQSQTQTPESSAYDTRAYNADMMKFKKMVMTSNEASGEFEQTSEYGIHPSASSSDISSR